MSNFGGIVGMQEGLEAGLVIGGASSSEEKHVGTAIGIGLAATSVGVVLGQQLGETVMGPLDTYIGDGGTSFLPALAIGGMVLWHNRRKQHSVQKTKMGSRVKETFKNLPLAAMGLFAGLEGVESGILTSTTNTNLATAEIITLSTAGAAVLAFGGLKKAIKKRRSPEQALLWTREIAMVPAIVIGASGAAELTTSVPGGIAVAAAGSVLLATAAVDNTKRIRDSFRRRKAVEES